ncbi:MAG: CCA tRNA nucleotidyltransferase [Erysipelotrichaceae bacterium]|nr:CCA tRNA nucleotidyltransferase [Erysipelotrichaceae bacterium]MBR6957744.1 CCA tRNA nucleotidyltransferase [Erysipelotrichaceae bacterium]
MKNIKLPDDVRMILNRFHENGYEAFIVGGCVRDSLLGDEPKDYDITTNALPTQVEQLFSDLKVVETGIRHGTVTVIINKEPYEITTYRTDVKYSDHRHPDEVRYALTLGEDLSRRDFTVNAMAYNEENGLIDSFNGVNDLNEGIIRCVGDPDTRFNEDALRILRCIRFASRYGFSIEENTESALFRNRELLRYVSVERVATEFNEIITSNKANEYLSKYRIIFETVMPQLEDLDFSLIGKVNRRLYMRISALFVHDDSLNAVSMLRHMHYSNKIIDEVSTLLDHADSPLETDYDIRRMFFEIGIKATNDLLSLKKARGDDLDYGMIRKRIRELRKSFIARDQMNINGDDLMILGYRGREIGQILDDLYEQILRDEIKNDHEELMKATLKGSN